MLYTDMYIVGFILIFAGLALVLYYFVLRFAASGTPKREAPAPHDCMPSGEPIVFSRAEAEPLREPAPAVSVAPPVSIPAPLPVVTIPASTAERQRGDTSSQTALPDGTSRQKDRAPESRLVPDLFATGYLYTDARGSSSALLDHPERAEAELTAHMRRLGPATLRFRHEAYQFDHGDGLLVIPEKKMREVRFSEGGTVFVPNGSELPLVYFFTVEAQGIRDFLSQRT